MRLIDAFDVVSRNSPAYSLYTKYRNQGRNNRVGRVGKVQGAPSVSQKYRPNYFLVITLISTVPKKSSFN